MRSPFSVSQVPLKRGWLKTNFPKIVFYVKSSSCCLVSLVPIWYHKRLSRGCLIPTACVLPFVLSVSCRGSGGIVILKTFGPFSCFWTRSRDGNFKLSSSYHHSTFTQSGCFPWCFFLYQNSDYLTSIMILCQSSFLSFLFAPFRLAVVSLKPLSLVVVVVVFLFSFALSMFLYWILHSM